MNFIKKSYYAQNYQDLAEFWISIPGSGASWEALQLLRAHFMGFYGYLAENTLFSALRFFGTKGGSLT